MQPRELVRGGRKKISRSRHQEIMALERHRIAAGRMTVQVMIACQHGLSKNDERYTRPERAAIEPAHHTSPSNTGEGTCHDDEANHFVRYDKDVIREFHEAGGSHPQ